MRSPSAPYVEKNIGIVNSPEELPSNPKGMLDFVTELFPICRSITGDGVRQTLSSIGSQVPVNIEEIPSGTQVFDWTVPDEWNIREAFIEDPDGNRVVDFRTNSLHVMSYSIPVDRKLDLDELRSHLHTLPDKPDLIPYRTSYYAKNWGFCLAHRKVEQLSPGKYHAVIRSTLAPGHLTYGELAIPGRSTEEVLVYSHLCHPSIANDNLSGLAVSVWWARTLMARKDLRYTYRFVWAPGTIGSITWLAMNQDKVARIRHGLVAVLLGRPGPFHYKRSRQGDAEIDRTAERVLKRGGGDFEIRDFDPYGYDERQFCSPGINLPVGRLTRVPNGEYPEYHTSGDNLELIDGDALEEALAICEEIGDELETIEKFENRFPNCEPQLGRRGLYRKTGGENLQSREYAMLWLLNLSDGNYGLPDIAEKSGVSVDDLRVVARELSEAGVLKRV